MKRRRVLSEAAWSLMQRLLDKGAGLGECQEPFCYRFHIVEDGVAGEVVHTMTMNALLAAGLIRESRSGSLSYKPTEKGVQALRRRQLQQTFASPWYTEENRVH